MTGSSSAALAMVGAASTAATTRPGHTVSTARRTSIAGTHGRRASPATATQQVGSPPHPMPPSPCSSPHCPVPFLPQAPCVPNVMARAPAPASPPSRAGNVTAACPGSTRSAREAAGESGRRGHSTAGARSSRLRPNAGKQEAWAVSHPSLPPSLIPLFLPLLSIFRFCIYLTPGEDWTHAVPGEVLGAVPAGVSAVEAQSALGVKDGLLVRATEFEWENWEVR